MTFRATSRQDHSAPLGGWLNPVPRTPAPRSLPGPIGPGKNFAGARRPALAGPQPCWVKGPGRSFIEAQHPALAGPHKQDARLTGGVDIRGQPFCGIFGHGHGHGPVPARIASASAPSRNVGPRLAITAPASAGRYGQGNEPRAVAVLGGVYHAGGRVPSHSIQLTVTLTSHDGSGCGLTREVCAAPS